MLSIGLFAQPANDDCAGIVHLGDAPSCDSTLYNNVGATESNIGFDNFPNCYVGVPDRDVWFSFDAVDTILDYRVEVIGCPDPNLGLASIVNPQIAVYRGDCEFDGLQLLDCVSAVAGESSVLVDLIGLTPGITYFLRINDWSSSGTPNEGAFKLCVTQKPPVNTVDDGGSNECSGILTDSGGETGDYGNDENFDFTICPTDPHGCILFEMNYYNIEFGADQISFFDGPDSSSPPLGTIDGSGTFTPNYGGVCYSVVASSGCLTVQFQSDANVTFEGFLGSWQCLPEDCSELEIPEMIVDADATPDDIVSSVISGQTLISLVNVDCAQGQVGTFTVTDDTDLSMDKGLVLSSGAVENIPAPASDFSAAFFGGINQSDDDLNYLSTISGNGSQSQDACIVELDVLAASEELTFEYVFGSEEYPEFVNSTFNDIFAFLVSGPGIVGDPNISDQLNVATLPDGTFIQINSVNHSSNWPYYRDNELNQSIVYDGLTSDTLGIKKSLTAVVPTIPCETYKLKFAIADRGDSSFDSGVFVSKINSGTPEIGVNYQSGIDYLVEECVNVPDEVVISFGNPISSPQTYSIVIAGNAELGVDYDLTIPSTVTFETGTEIFTFSIIALTDNIVEGTDTIEIQLVRDFGCGSIVVSTIIIEIFDNVNVEILETIDTAIICATAGCIPLEVSGADTYSWMPDSLFNDPTAAETIVCTQTSQWITVEGTLGGCTDIDSIYLNVIDLELNILPDVDALQICAGETVTLFAENNVNDAGLNWTSFSVLDDPSNPEQVIVDPGFGVDFLNVTVEEGGCTASDGININWVPFDFPALTNDTIICQNFSVDLGADIISNSTTYEWTPDIYLTPSADVSGPIATPEETTTYTLIATAGDGDNVCADTSTITIEVIPVDIEIQNPDTTFVCVGDSVTLTSINTTGGVGVTWTPNEFLIEISPEEVIVFPPISNWYYNILETANCQVIDSVFVRIDSLPELSIMADPAKPSYCIGEEVFLLSPTYEPAHFPGIDLMWEGQLPGAQTPDSFLNLVILAVETFTYIRTTTVGACVSVDSILINVTPVVEMSVMPELDTICQGESVQFTIDGPPELTEFTWMPPDGLSCTDCPNPIASPSVTTTYQVQAEFEGCPVGASATLIVPATLFQFPGPGFICAGQSVQLNALNIPGATYSWTSSDGSLTTNDAQPIVTPPQTTTYFLTATMADCTLETEITIVVSQDFSVSIEPVGVACPGDPTSLSVVVDPAIGNYNFQWSNDLNPNTPTGQMITVNPPETATFTVEVNDGCFTNTSSILVEVAPAYTITATPPTAAALQGQPVTFTAEATVAGIDFVWTDEAGNVVGNGETLTVEECNSHEYTVTATDFNGCEQTATVQLVVDEFTVSVTPAVDTIIAGGSSTFTASANVDGLNYTWTLSGSTDPIATGPTLTVSSCSTQAYVVTGEDDNGCSASATAGLFVIDGFSVDTIGIIQSQADTLEGLYEGEEIEIITSTTPPLNGATYIWLLNGDTLAITNSPSSGTLFLPEIVENVDASFQVVVINADGCDDNLSLPEMLLNNPVELPNVFTPNGDGDNDNFTIVSLIPVDILEFRVWNRWGKLVYENENGTSGWDGNLNGDPAASDVYIYSVVYQIPGSANPMSPLRGDVTLLR